MGNQLVFFSLPVVSDKGIPYLFILYAEEFSYLIKRAVSRGIWPDIQMGFQAPLLSHLFDFVDDCLLFMQNSSDCVNILLEVIGDYERALRQRINTNKSSIFFSKKIPLDQRLCITQRFDMQVSSGAGKYLGLPYLIGHSKTEVFERTGMEENSWMEGEIIV